MLYIDFKKGEGSPTRIFSAATEFIHAFEKLDKVLSASIDTSIRPAMILEDIEVGSLKIWLRNALEATDDQSLRDLEWRKIVGAYLLSAKYAVLSWIDDDKAPRSLPGLRKQLQQLAAETDVRHLPDYSPPDPIGLIEAAKQIQTAKDLLDPKDRVIFQNADHEIEINMSVRLEADKLAELATKETIRVPPAPMILAVKKPDYLGNSKWEFRHGRKPIFAKIEDEEFLSNFQNRETDVRPGDALRCQVSVEMKYGFDNELISENFIITEVSEVLDDRPFQSSFL